MKVIEFLKKNITHEGVNASLAHNVETFMPWKIYAGLGQMAPVFLWI